MVSAPNTPVAPKEEPVPPPEQSRISTVNLHLLRSRALLADGQVARALESAEKALLIAEESHTYHLVCKSHLYRGLCYMELSMWKKASDDFTRAANVRGWAEKVAELKSTAEKNLLEEMEKAESTTAKAKET